MNDLTPPPMFSRIEPGSEVISTGKRYRIDTVLNYQYAAATRLEDQKPELLRIDQMEPPPASPPGQTQNSDDNNRHIHLHAVSDKRWLEAQRRLDIIKPLLCNPKRTRADVASVAKQHQVAVSTIYEWIRAFLQANHLSALVPMPSGPRIGTWHLRHDIEQIIQSCIESDYLTKQRLSIMDVYRQVRHLCAKAKLVPPSYLTVRARIRAVDPSVRLRKRGFIELADSMYTPTPGKMIADFPMQYVQIDHTPADVILVDETTRKSIGRPYVTVATDIFSGMVVGLYISFEKPSAISVGMCLAMAMCPKGEYLKRVGVPGEWPVWGKIATVHTDNGMEFRGTSLQRSCRAHAIDLQHRPAGIPRYGGHIERMIGTLMLVTRTCPGSTGHNIQQRKGTDPEKTASLTMTEYEQILVNYIIGFYHNAPRKETGLSPIVHWMRGRSGDGIHLPTGFLDVPCDPARIYMDFMPFEWRVVLPTGVRIKNFFYWHDQLRPFINAMDPDNPSAKRKYIVCYDPRDISRVFFQTPDHHYITLHVNAPGAFPISSWEAEAARAELRKIGREHFDENQLFAAIERMRSIVTTSQAATKAARRRQARQPHRVSTSAGIPDTIAPATKPRVAPLIAISPPTATAPDDDGPITPFEEVVFQDTEHGT